MMMMMMMMKTSKGTVLINVMVIKNKELADVILVNICFRTLLISLLFVFVFKRNLSCVYLQKRQTKIEKYTVVGTHYRWDVLAKILNSAFVNIAKCVNKFLKYYFKRWLFLQYGTICLKKHEKYPMRSSILVKLQGAILQP